MPSSYTSSLRLTLPATGELSGTWGTVCNTGITELTDAAIAGYVSVAMTDADYTLTVANGLTDQARRMMLNITGTLTLARNVICPTASKLYIIKNSTTGGFAITLKTSAGSGISIPNGASMLLMCDGTNVVNAVTNFSSLTLGSPLVATSGGTGQSAYAVGDLLYASTTTALSKLADVATGNALISGGVGVAPSWGKVGLTTHVTGTLPVANGGTGITSFGAGVATWLGTPSSANLAAAVTDETGSGALVFATSPTFVTPNLGTPASGVVTNLTGTASININGTVGATTPTTGAFTTLSASSTITLSGGTANGVAYANASKVLTTGSTLTFDGTNLKVGSALTLATATPYFSGGNIDAGANTLAIGASITGFFIGGSEQMRLTSTGLGIGTSTPSNKLTVDGNANITGNVTLGDATTDTVTVNGYMGVGGGGSASVGVNISNSALTGGTQYGALVLYAATSSATTAIAGIRTQPTTAAAAFTVSDLIGYWATNPTKGAGSTITNQHGMLVADQTQGTNNYGITSLVSSGTNKWNIYASGTAANYFAGNVGVGAISTGAALGVRRTDSTIVAFQAVTNGAALESGRVDFQNAFSSAVDGNAIARISFGTGANNASGYLALHTASASNSPIERMRIDSAGNVGIGASVAASKLHVQSTSGDLLYVDGQNTTTGAIGTGAAITFGGHSGSTAITTGRIGVYKENSTVGNTAAYLAFFKKPNAGALSEAMRLDASGNLGLGVTPSAWGAFADSNKGFDVGTYASFAQIGSSGGAAVASNAVKVSGTVWNYRNTNAAGYFESAQGTHKWFTAPSGTAGNAITFTQAMTLDASGNLLVGTTSAPTGGSTRDVVFYTPNNATTSVKLANGLTGVAATDGFDLIMGSSSDAYVFNRENGPLIFGTNSTERARIDSTGNLGLGVTAFGTSAAKVLGMANATAPTTSPAGMGQLYVEGGALKFRGSSGTVTTIAPA